jgi:hypothetical protein
MAVETFMGILLLENARRSEHKLSVAKRFITDTRPRVQMLAERIVSLDMKSIDEYREILG